MRMEDGTYRKKCVRYDQLGDVHFLTFHCFANQPFFSGPRAPHWLLESLNTARTRKPFDLLAFVIMPEHVHLLLAPHSGVPISGVLVAIKQPVARRAVAWVKKHRPDFLPRMLDLQPNGKRHYRFWERGGGYDRNVQNVEEVHEKMKYIHLNPVRRELVDLPEQWPWSSYRAWYEGIDEPIAIDRQSIPTRTPK